MAENTEDAVKTQTDSEVVATNPRISELLVITGHIHQLREWSERLDDVYIYETMGTIVAVYEPYLTRPHSSPFNEAILVIKDKVRLGPTFKIIFPLYDRSLPSFVLVGNTVRIVGKLMNKYSMRAMKVTCPTRVEINNFERITHVCYHRIVKYLQDIAPK